MRALKKGKTAVSLRGQERPRANQTSGPEKIRHGRGVQATHKYARKGSSVSWGPIAKGWLDPARSCLGLPTLTKGLESRRYCTLVEGERQGDIGVGAKAAVNLGRVKEQWEPQVRQIFT